MVGKAVSSATEGEVLEATVVWAVPRGVRTPRLVKAKSKMLNRGGFMCNSLLAGNFHFEIEDGGGNRPKRNQDP
jgi:hypothetical protein